MKMNNVVIPIFDFNTESITLYKGNSKIVRKEVEYDGYAEIKFNCLPKANIKIEAEYDDPRLSSIIDDDEVNFSINEFKPSVFVVSSSIQLEPVKTKLKLVSKQNDIQIISNDKEKAKYIIFHIFNFFKVTLKDDSEVVAFNDGVMCRLNYFYLESKLYKIKIQSTRDTNSNIQDIDKDGISRLTQVGRIEKKNSSISIEEYNKLQNTLTYFLSFSKGSWINPCCSIGKNKQEKQIFGILNSPKSEWKSLDSWIDPLQNLSSISEFFPLFMDRWESERWKDTLEEVIYWFLNANDGSRGIDAGLILAQTALERLSFEYVVHEKKLLLVKGFKDLWASDKFRILFSSLNIPLDIPVELIYLTKEAKKDNWLDAPHALTVIRNSLVHPEHKKHGKYNFHIFKESHTLSLWYLEIAILAICGFKGEYANRFKRGAVEKVPYVTSM
jgi:hypothetical protein